MMLRYLFVSSMAVLEIAPLNIYSRNFLKCCLYCRINLLDDNYSREVCLFIYYFLGRLIKNCNPCTHNVQKPHKDMGIRNNFLDQTNQHPRYQQYLRNKGSPLDHKNKVFTSAYLMLKLSTPLEVPLLCFFHNI